MADQRDLKKKKTKKFNPDELPPIPDRLYFTIGDTGHLCAVETHVLRYWEEFFPIHPTKRRGGRRSYTRDDIILIRRICDLLYNKGFTIEGAQAQLLKESKGDRSQFELTERLKKILNDLETVMVTLDEEAA